MNRNESSRNEPKFRCEISRKLHEISVRVKRYFGSTNLNFVRAKRNFVIEKFLTDQGAVVSNRIKRTQD